MPLGPLETRVRKVYVGPLATWDPLVHEDHQDLSDPKARRGLLGPKALWASPGAQARKVLRDRGAISGRRATLARRDQKVRRDRQEQRVDSMLRVST